MSKQKRKKLTFWSKYKMPIIAIVAFSAIVYVIIYLVFKENGIFPVGTGLEKSDWLSFLGAYLSFIGTVIVSLIAIFQSIYYNGSKISRNYWLFESKCRNNAEITYTQRLQIASYFP